MLDAFLHPIYPAPALLVPLLSPAPAPRDADAPALTPDQKAELVAHSVARACLFGDLNLLSFLLADPHARPYLDLDVNDEDGLGLLSVIITGFGIESERDVEREECVRLLVSEGVNINNKDDAGWTPLHHAALLAPPTLVSYLVTHGADVLATTKRNLTALDVIRAHTPIPGREDIALLLQEAMREQGWQGSRLDINRDRAEQRKKSFKTVLELKQAIGKTLELQESWWGPPATSENDILKEIESEADAKLDEQGSEPMGDNDWSTMLVYSPNALPHIFRSLITDFRPSLRNADPAQSLFLLCRFASLWGDPDWIEDLIAGAVDKIEEAVYSCSEDLPSLTFWLFNSTILLHLLRSDPQVSDVLENLALFGLLEELINAIFVFVIRTAERHVDPLIEASLLDHISLVSEFEGIKFESEWSFFRSLQSRKRGGTPSKPTAQSLHASMRDSPLHSSPIHLPRPESPIPNPPLSPALFSSLRQTFAPMSSAATPVQSNFLFSNSRRKAPPGPHDLTTFLSALHALLCLTGINPALIAQAFSQIFYWTACEMFNRILTRKKYLCRSRAIQIAHNLSVVETWADGIGLPSGVISHFSPVYELLHWLQTLSSIDEFSSLVAIIQALRNLNPFQMRRAMKEYRYEVGEGRMNEECVQYLAQVQKDWERHRVKVGVDSLRKELQDRELEDALSDSTSEMPIFKGHEKAPSTASSIFTTESMIQENVDRLFDLDCDRAEWLPPKPPPVLGELLESRHMLPIILPSDSRFLAAVSTRHGWEDVTRGPFVVGVSDEGHLQERRNGFGGKKPALQYELFQCNLATASLRSMTLVDGAEWTIQRHAMEGEADEHDSEIGSEPPAVVTEDLEDEDLTSVLRPQSPHFTSLQPPLGSRRQRRESGDDS